MAMTPALYYILYTTLPATFVTWLFLKRHRPRRHDSIANLPGPPPSSWLAGNLPAFIRAENVGDMDAESVAKYGLVMKMKGLLGQDILYLADPQAIQYVLNTCGYTFHKKDMLFLFNLIGGPSLIGVEGDDHARQRKILAPGFSHAALKEFVPLFMHLAQKAAGQWRELLLEDSQSSPVIDVYAWLSRITLDSIGQAAFSFDFGALSDVEGSSEFLKAYRNVFVDMFHKPTDMELVISTVFKYLPFWLIPVLLRLPIRGVKRLKIFKATAMKVVLGIVERETHAHTKGLPHGNDIMSILVRANRSEAPKGKLSDKELLCQMMAMLAGHDTTSATLVWLFYELSRHREVQSKLRAEIKAARAAAKAAGRDELEASDFQSMAYTIAVIKETLRFYPIAAHNARRAGRDEVIPLSKPVQTITGEKITAIPIKQNHGVVMSIWAYNRIKTLWGEDAEQWQPERFLGSRLADKPKNSLGVYANLATFSSGVHSCIGWRFAILQMQAVLITLIEKFEILPPPSDSNVEILRGSAPTLIPVVKGREKEGAQMPLRIAAIYSAGEC